VIGLAGVFSHPGARRDAVPPFLTAVARNAGRDGHYREMPSENRRRGSSQQIAAAIPSPRESRDLRLPLDSRYRGNDGVLGVTTIRLWPN
jgi:hypothetical protein